MALFAILHAYGQRFGVIALGHLWCAWMSIMHAIS